MGKITWGLSPQTLPVDSEGPVGGQKGQKGQKGEALIGDSGRGINCYPSRAENGCFHGDIWGPHDRLSDLA